MDMWLRAHRSQRTRDTYHADIAGLFDFTGNKPLQQVTLLDLLDYEVSLRQARLRAMSIVRKLSAIKSLLSFCLKAGSTSINVGAALKLPAMQPA